MPFVSGGVAPMSQPTELEGGDSPVMPPRLPPVLRFWMLLGREEEKKWKPWPPTCLLLEGALGGREGLCLPPICSASSCSYMARPSLISLATPGSSLLVLLDCVTTMSFSRSISVISPCAFLSSSFFLTSTSSSISNRSSSSSRSSSSAAFFLAAGAAGAAEAGAAGLDGDACAAAAANEPAAGDAAAAMMGTACSGAEMVAGAVGADASLPASVLPSADLLLVLGLCDRSRCWGGRIHLFHASFWRRYALSLDTSTTDESFMASTISIMSGVSMRTRLKLATTASGIQPSSSILERRKMSLHRFSTLK
mmetsp:Transcript_34535/g.87306  ORF Transcript_34535/g.87306 Transcript_34535/m.87306 type:complete len:309 (-) Transcript_34535:1454-2380(-)